MNCNFFKKQYPPPVFGTDIHTHLLPGVDDGSCSVEETLEVLSFLKGKGGDTVFFTPHIMADYPENDARYLKECFCSFMEEHVYPAKELFPQVGLAAEYMLDEDFDRHLKEGLLTYDGSHVLVEMSCVQRPLDLDEKLYEMQLRGYIPLLAHPERYLFLSDKEYIRLKEKGCRYQLNLFSLQGFYGHQEVKQRAEALLKKNLYDFAGSDIHSPDYQFLYSSSFLDKNKYALIEKLTERNRLLCKLPRVPCKDGEQGTST